MLPTYTDENTSELNLSELLGKAKERGWKKYSKGGEDQELTPGTVENLFREASGSGLKDVGMDPENGDTKKIVYMGKRSLGAI